MGLIIYTLPTLWEMEAQENKMTICISYDHTDKKRHCQVCRQVCPILHLAFFLEYDSASRVK